MSSSGHGISDEIYSRYNIWTFVTVYRDFHKPRQDMVPLYIHFIKLCQMPTISDKRPNIYSDSSSSASRIEIQSLASTRQCETLCL